MISLCLVVVAAICDAARDAGAFHNYEIGDYSFNPNKTWLQKYKNLDVAQGPAFFGSTTFMVWATDGWHLMKMMMLVSLCLAIGLYTPLIGPLVDAAIYHTVFGIVFEVFFSKVFK